jgi:hypothetical protein
MTLIGFAGVIVPENLEGNGPPQTRPTRSGRLHTRSRWHVNAYT